MSKPLDGGLAEFRAALKPQEGRFMREATYIMNAPKDMSVKPSGAKPEKKTDNKRVAEALLNRNPNGQFAKKDDGEDDE